MATGAPRFPHSTHSLSHELQALTLQNPHTKAHTFLRFPPLSAMAGSQAREVTPPPVIGKAGRYTVFITPPATPNPSEPPRTHRPIPKPSPGPSPRNAAPLPAKAPPSPPPPPVQVPPQQFFKPGVRSSSRSSFGFFWDAVAKVQDVHSSMDEYLADWFGLNQSKYQWALNDYYENNALEKEGGKPKEHGSKGQAV